LSKKKIHLSDEDIGMVEKLTKYSVLINIELLKKFLEKFKIEYSIEDDVEKNYTKIINELRKSINEKNEDKTSALGQRLSIIQRCLKMKYIIEKNIVNTRIFLPF